MLKALLGLGIALRLFDIEHKYNPFPTKSEFYIHKYVDGNWKIDNKINSSDAETRAFEAIRFSTLDGQLDDNDKKVAWAVTKLGNFRSIFSAGAKADAIILASQWLFDSYVGKDELLSYIQAMVVLEILLGDKAASEEIGLGQLLRNRCAYLISTTPKERAELLQDFNKIYEVRSQIVHRGKHRLNADERVLFHRLRWMCRRVIQEEVKLLETESKARA